MQPYGDCVGPWVSHGEPFYLHFRRDNGNCIDTYLINVPPSGRTLVQAWLGSHSVMDY